MPKLTLTDETSGFATTTARNANYQLIEDEFEKVLYRNDDSGDTSPMQQELDMNSNKILNVTAGTSGSDAVNLAQVNTIVGSSVSLENATIVPTVSALRAASTSGLSSGTYAVTQGYYNAGDGGEGHYRFVSGDTTAEDNFITIEPTDGGGRWFLLTRDSIANVRQAGAAGDGTTDDTVSIQRAINSGLKTIYFPRPDLSTGYYRITDTLNVGGWSIDAGTGNVQGFFNSRSGISFIGQFKTATGSEVQPGTTIKWEGADQPGTNATTLSDSVGSYTYITDDKPMIAIRASGYVTMENLFWDGGESGARAHACIHFEAGLLAHAVLRNVKTDAARIGLRNGTRIRHDTFATYYGYGDSPWYKANVIDYTAFGGYQGDSHTYISCDFRGEVTGVSQESEQNITNAHIGGEINGGTYGIIHAGGWLNLQSVAFNRSGATYDIFHVTGSLRLTGQDVHTETGATWHFNGTSFASEPLISYIQSDAAKFRLPNGGGNITLINCRDVNLQRLDADRELFFTVENSTVDTLTIDSTTVKDNVHLTVNNCESTNGTILAGGGIADTYYTISNTVMNTEVVNERRIAGASNRGYFFDKRDQRFNGWYHECLTLRTLPDNVATLAGSFSRGANGRTGSCDLTVVLRDTSGANMAAGTFKYVFTWTSDSSGNVTLSAVSTIVSNTALDGYSSLTLTPTIAYDAGDDEIDLSLNQNNDLNNSLVGEIRAIVSTASNSTTSTSSGLTWTPA